MTRFLPLVVFMVLVGFFTYRLILIEQGNAPDVIPSALLNRSLPEFSLPPLMEGAAPLATQSLKGKVTLVSVFASWCVPCQTEHPLLADVKKAGIVVVGINYKDTPENARKWLDKLGNPYETIGMDRDGYAAIDLGVYGVPESYLVDKKGIIRFKQAGPLSSEIIQNRILPLAKELQR